MTNRPDAAADAERIVAFRLLALGLRTPTEELLAEVVVLAGALEEHGGLAPLAGALCRAAEASPPMVVAASQERLFGGQVAVPPYEGSYEADPFRQARQIADVAGFYRAFGAEAHGPAVDRPDHAGSELEFLAFVASRRAEAAAAGRDADADACREVERLFLSEHAGRWLPAFFATLAGTAVDPFHVALGRLGEAALVAAMTSLGVEAERVPSRAPRTQVEADELTCASGDEAVIPGL